MCRGNFAQCERHNYLGSRCDGGFAEYCLIPNAWHLVQSKSASMEALCMTEPACVAQHAVRKANVTAGSFVVIFGAGPVGVMAARWVKLFGGHPLLVDVVEKKVSFAQEKGFDAVNSMTDSVLDTVRFLNRGRLADAAIEGTGVGTVMTSCIDCVRVRGTVALLGNPGGETKLALTAHSSVMRKELNLVSVWNSSRKPWPVDEWQFTVQLLDEGKLEVTDLITHRLSLDELPQAMADIQSGKIRIVKAICV